MSQRPAQAPARRGRRTTGQALLIFALMATVLFAIAGLGVDTAVNYLAAAAADRAAAAGATAGVTFMPQDFSGAAAKAFKTVEANGFALSAVPTCGSTAGTTGSPCLASGVNGNNQPVTVSVARHPLGCAIGGTPACDTNRLTVIVSETVPTTFMHLLGVGSTKVAQVETAEYLHPIGLGQDSAQLGATDQTFGTGPASAFIPDQEGWGVARQNGDAFTPDPGSAYPSNSAGGAPDLHAASPALGTDNASMAGLTVPGVGTTTSRGGYNYLVWVGPGQTSQLQVWNPIFAPDNNYNPYAASGAQPLPEGNFMPTTGSPASDYVHTPPNYATMSYTVFQVTDLYNRNLDVPLARTVVKPIDAWNAPTSFYDIYGNQTITGMPASFHQWYNVMAPPDPSETLSDGTQLASFATNVPASSTLSGGAAGAYYRLRVETFAGDGTDPATSKQPIDSLKFYSVRAADSTGANPCPSNAGTPTCTVSGINDISVTNEIQTAADTTMTLPLLDVPQEYAGRQIGIYIFDPGDVGTNPPPNTQMATSLSLSICPGYPASIPQGSLTMLCAQINPASGSFNCTPNPGYDVTFIDTTTNTTIGTANPCYSGTDGLAKHAFDSTDGYSVSPGNNQIIAKFGGTTAYAPATSNTVTVAVTTASGQCKVTLTASPPSPLVFNSNWFYVHATITDATTGAPLTGTVSFYNAGPPDYLSNHLYPPGSSGQSSDTLDQNGGDWGTWNLTWGSYEIIAVLSDNSQYPNCSSPPIPYTVTTDGPGATTNPSQPTTTTVTATQSSVVVGTPVTFTATIGPNPGGGGVDFFYVDKWGNWDWFCSGTVGSGGTASCNQTVPDWADNTTGLVACFESYGNFQASCSSTTAFAVSPAPSSPSPPSSTTPPPTPPPSVTTTPKPYAMTWPPHRAHTGRALQSVGGACTAGSTSVCLGIVLPPQPALGSTLLPASPPFATAAANSGVTDIGPSLDGLMLCPDFSGYTNPDPRAGHFNCPDASMYVAGSTSCGSTTCPIAEIQTEDSSGGNLFNGKWVAFTLNVPADYASICTSTDCYWSLSYFVPGGMQTHDTLTIDVNPGASPVHLLAPGA